MKLEGSPRPYPAPSDLLPAACVGASEYNLHGDNKKDDP